MISELLHLDPAELWLTLVIADFARFLVIVVPAFFLLWVLGRRAFRRFLVQGRYPKAQHVRREMRYSLLSGLIFGTTGVGVHLGARHGYLGVYTDVGQHGWLYFGFTVALMIVLQDAYFYWTHRAMHHPVLYKHVHRVHHLSTNPSPWAAYSFAPAEAIAHAAFVPLFVAVMPVHESVLAIFMVYMTVRNVHGHTSMEFMPKGFIRHGFWRSHTTVTHHNQHHKKFQTNFGLYFTWWDRWMGTMDAGYEELFDSTVARATAASSDTSMQTVTERRAAA